MNNAHPIAPRCDRRAAWLAAAALACLTVLPLLAAPPSEPLQSGIALFEAHDFSAASRAFHAILKTRPNDLQALIYLGRIAFEQNRLDEALDYFNRATAAAPASSVAFHWLGRVNGVKARDLGPPRGIGAARRTKKALEQAVLLDPNNLDARVDLATFYREAPAIVGGSTRAALEQLDEIKRRDPYEGGLVQGDLAVDEKKYEEAEGHYRKAVELAPAKTPAHFRLGLLHQRTGRYDSAFAEFATVLRLDPAEKRALFQIGKTADLSGLRLAQGEEALKSYLQCQPFFIMPKLSWAHRRLGNIYRKEGRLEAARDEYLAALRLAPEDKEAAKALKQLEAAAPAPAK
jgi:tetratricopeptide (TPR) repeat protein